jgi:GxxExxY protein
MTSLISIRTEFKHSCNFEEHTIIMSRSWSDTLRANLEARHHLYGDIMYVVKSACHEIMETHKSRQTESFYEKMLACHLYERGIPYMTQVDCFVQRGTTQVLVGRLDMEIAHNTILELKVAPRVTSADKAQLMKYVRSKQACGMKLEHAAVVCFRDDGNVEIVEAEMGISASGEASSDHKI